MSASTDVESQSPAARSRSRCLDIFLTVSVIALFIMFAIALVGALWFAIHIEKEINERKSREQDGFTNSLIAPQTGSAYKMQNFAYLRASKSDLKESVTVMEWESIQYGKGQTIGSLYSYNKAQNVLNVKKSGSYFLYVQLSLSCKGICGPNKLTVSFYDQPDREKLTCSVSLPDVNNYEPINGTCWRVVTFLEDETRLLAKSQFQNTTGDWKLQMNDSGFGMFLVDGVQEAHRT